MHLLYYWRRENYEHDRDFGFMYHLNQNSPRMLEARPSESLWAFMQRRDGRYVLAADLRVRAVTHNAPNYHYGRYRVSGDRDASRYFDIDRGPSAELLIRNLSVRAGGQHLGQSFQGHAAVRTITHDDHRLLAAFARDLPTLGRVEIYPEDQIEARLVYGDPPFTYVAEETEVAAPRRLRYLREHVVVARARELVVALQELYGGRCQVCRFDPRDLYGRYLCHGHHLEWLSRGGEDTRANMLLVCPNHHAAIHQDDAPFDFTTLSFGFSNGRIEAVQENRHLLRAS